MLERAARAVVAGAPLYTASYVRGYAGANGIIFSRGAMIAAAIAKVTGARPRVLGKPSRAAVAELRSRLGIPTAELAVIGDDLGMDIALGRLGGSTTVLVRSGISGAIDLELVPEGRRPDAAIDRVADLLGRLEVQIESYSEPCAAPDQPRARRCPRPRPGAPATRADR